MRKGGREEEDEATGAGRKAVPEVNARMNSVAAEVGTCYLVHSVRVMGDSEGEAPVRYTAAVLLLGCHRVEGSLRDHTHDLGSVCCDGESVRREGGRCSTAAGA